MKICNCLIQKYDPSITTPPHKFITLVRDVKVVDPESNDGGHNFATNLRKACAQHGYEFRFYSMSKEPGVDFELCVRGELEDMIESPLDRVTSILQSLLADRLG